MSLANSKKKAPVVAFLALAAIMYLAALAVLPYASPKFMAQNRCPVSNESEYKKLAKFPPVIVQPTGGLGNRLFQYAAAYSLAKQRNSDLYLCLPPDWAAITRRSLLEFGAGDRSYMLSVFNIPHDKVLISERGSCNNSMPEITKNYVSYPNEEDIITENLPEDRALYMRGYMESEIFFKSYKKDIFRLYTLKTGFDHSEEFYNITDPIALTIRQSKISVAIHWRRGDYASQNIHLPISYYDAAIKLMKAKITEKYLEEKTNITFFVFSDDIERVQADFRNISENFVFVSNRNLSRLADFILMSICKHNIVSNSTFSWWAAYLNRNKDQIVIAPSPRYKPEVYKQNPSWGRILYQIYGGVWTYPYHWITINPYNRTNN